MRVAIQEAAADVDSAQPADRLCDQADELVKVVSERSVEMARDIIHRAATAWWTGLNRGMPGLRMRAWPTSAAAPRLAPATEAAAERFGAVLAGRPVAEAAAEIGRLYCSLLPAEYRASRGVFYTPPPLVRYLLDAAESAGHDWLAGKVIDPSCGGGAFLVEAAARIGKALGRADPAIIMSAVSARLTGWELDPFAAWLSHVCVEASLMPLVAASGRRLSDIVDVRDSLHQWDDHAGRYALVMGNPAFGKIKDDPCLRARFRRSLYGHPNLYGLFTDLAVHLAASDRGLIAYLTPASFLGGQYFRALRRLLCDQAPPVSIAVVERRQDIFDDVLQEVALSVFRRGREASSAQCFVAHVGQHEVRPEPVGRLIMPRAEGAAWLMPRRAGDMLLVERMRRMSARLSDWGYRVSTGPLVWNRKKPQLHADARMGAVPVVWAEAVGENGKFRLAPQKRHHAPYYSPAGPRDPNLVAATCLLVQRTTSKEQARRLVSAVLPQGIIDVHGAVAVENHLNMILPRGRPPAVPLDVLAAFFATEVADSVIRCINASVALSASEIEEMPLPTAPAVIAAMAARDPESALRSLYGI